MSIGAWIIVAIILFIIVAIVFSGIKVCQRINTKYDTDWYNFDPNKYKGSGFHFHG